MTEPAISAVAPVFSVDGQLTRNLARDCLFLEVSEGVEGLRRMQASFLATAGGATGPPDPMLYLDGGDVDFGRALQVSIGPEGLQRYVFDGTISAIEAVFVAGESPLVMVLAEDALMRLRMTRRMRTYSGVTDADIVAELAGEHGLEPDVDPGGPTYDVVQQLNQSDLAFLRERARLVQAELWCTGRTLHFRGRRQREGTTLTLFQGDELRSVRLCADLSHQRSTVAITGYDAQHQEVIDEQVGPDVVDAEVTRGRTGPRLVEQALGTSVSFRVREAALTCEEAEAWARAEMLRRGRRFVTVSGVARGSPDMVVGSRLRLELVGEAFDGDGYYVTKVTHRYDHHNGFRTCFEAERATVNEVA